MMPAVQPQWIAKMYAGKVGRDHLGLGSVSSDQILPSLSPAINVLTHHPRYYSFYVFLLDEFWRRERPGNEKAWIQFYRPREFVFSVGAHLCEQAAHQDVGKIVGATITQGLALQRLEAYNTQTYYIKSDLGGCQYAPVNVPPICTNTVPLTCTNNGSPAICVKEVIE